MTFGPLEYLVIEFEGNHFTGEILPELRALRDEGVVRVIDLVFIQKDNEGHVSARELSDLSVEEAKPFDPIAGDMTRLLSPEDVEDVAESVSKNSSVAIALLEHTWATHLQETIVSAQGKLLGEGLVPLAMVQSLEAELATEHAALHG